MITQDKEQVAIPVSDRRSLTPYVFYDYFVPALKDCLLSKPNSMISFDMTYVESISPLVLPNLLILGMILRKHFHAPVHIVLGTENLEVVRFLKRTGFFDKLDEYVFFTYDEKIVKRFAGKCARDLAVLRYEPVTERAPEIISAEMLKNESERETFLNQFPNAEIRELFFHTVGQLAHNCSEHGDAPALISLYGGPKIGLHCAVSDCGIGYLDSLLKPRDPNAPKSDRVCTYSSSELKNEDKYQHFRAIIQAVCTRFNKETYGLSHVIRDIARVGGTTRVHSVNTQVVFTQSNQGPFLDSDNVEEPGRTLADSLIELAKRSISLQTSPVRIRNSKLAGVHIEFEIPPRDIQTERKIR